MFDFRFLLFSLAFFMGCSQDKGNSKNLHSPPIQIAKKNGIGIMTFNTEWLLENEQQAERLKQKGIWGLEEKLEESKIEEQHLAVTKVIADYVPDLLCLQEVINQGAANRLIKTLKNIGLHYDLFFLESRENYLEQDVAFIVKKNSGFFSDIKVRYPEDPQNPSKCLILTCKMNGKYTAFIGLHLKSVPTRQSSVELRETQADSIVSELMALDRAGYQAIVLGDFNDWDPVVPDADESPEATPVSNVLKKIKDYKSGGNRELMNVMRFIKPISQRFTYDYQGSETALDHILIPVTLESKVVEATIPKEVGEDASDHLPVLIRLGIGAKNELPLIAEPILEILPKDQINSSESNILKSTSSDVLQIISLVPNPEGIDSGREQLTIRNTSNDIVSLEDWKLMDAANNTLNLKGFLKPRSNKLIVLKNNVMPLNNNGDLIRLYNLGNEVQQVRYSASQAGDGVRLMVHILDKKN